MRSGKSIIRQIENLDTQGDKPVVDATISDCGELTGADAEAAAADTKTADALGDAYEDFPEDSDEKLDSEKILKIAADCKEYGNKAFKGGDAALALDKYQKGLRYLNEDTELDEAPADVAKQSAALRFTLNNNSAMMNLKLESWQEAEHAAANALAVSGTTDAEKAKALYRRGVALIKMKDEDAAIQALEQAQKLVPGDAAINKELESVKKAAAARLAKEKAAYKKFFA